MTTINLTLEHEGKTYRGKVEFPESILKDKASPSNDLLQERLMFETQCCVSELVRSILNGTYKE